MTLQTVPLDTPPGITARLGWDPATSVHDRRRIIAKELIAAQLGCEIKDITIEREAPRGFGYHRRLVAARAGRELDIAVTTASYRAATIVSLSDPALPVGLDIRDMHPDDDELAQMRRHSHLLSEAGVPDLLDHWTKVQAVLEADGRGVRVAPERVRLDATRHRGWIPDHNAKYTITDASRDGWIITIAVGAPPQA